jgi:flagellum-specific ATP synthase
VIALDRYCDLTTRRAPVRVTGRVCRVVGMSVVASGPPASVGELCRIEARDGWREAVVIGFREDELLLQPLGRIDGIRPGDAVEALAHGLSVPVGPGLIGRVISGIGEPLDGLGPIAGKASRSVDSEPPAALGRRPIEEILETGIRAVDALCTLGKGQRIGIFAGAGLGKSMLLGEMAKYAKADINVIALVGERGREVGEFISKVLGPEGMARSVVIAATSDRPAVERLTAAKAAHAVAEHFRDAGLDVLLMMDSLTRFCHAQREIGLAGGEPPTVRGYPPSSFALLPGLLERAGTGTTGSITGIYTVLVDGDETEDPVAETVRAILDGHLILSRELSERAIYPSIDMSKSVSRLQVDIVSDQELALAQDARSMWGEYQRVRDLVEIGAYNRGTDPRIDRALDLEPRLVAFLRQGLGEASSREHALAILARALSGKDEAQ